MFYNDFGDFLNNPPSFGSNSVFGAAGAVSGSYSEAAVGI